MLMIGSSPKGVSSIYLGDNFAKGYTSDQSETFEHPIISSKKDFIVKKMEVWGFDWV